MPSLSAKKARVASMSFAAKLEYALVVSTMGMPPDRSRWVATVRVDGPTVRVAEASRQEDACRSKPAGVATSSRSELGLRVSLDVHRVTIPQGERGVRHTGRGRWGIRCTDPADQASSEALGCR